MILVPSAWRARDREGSTERRCPVDEPLQSGSALETSTTASVIRDLDSSRSPSSRRCTAIVDADACLRAFAIASAQMK